MTFVPLIKAVAMLLLNLAQIITLLLSSAHVARRAWK